MPRNWKKIAFLVILLQILFLPILIIANKQKQNTSSKAAELNYVLSDESVGNAKLSEGKDFSGAAIPESSIKSPKLATIPNNEQNNSILNKEVYAYLPYWEVNSETDIYLQYKFLSHLIYHGISLGKNGVINKSNGPWNTWQSATMSKIVSNARAKGVKVLPNIVLFNSSSNQNLNEFLDNPQARTKAVDQIVNFLETSPQPVDGVAIDFEYPGSAQKDELTNFIELLRTRMNEVNPNWDLIIAVDSSSYVGYGFDLPKLSKNVDSFFIMSYHLRNASASTRAGSTNPYSALNNLADNYLAKIPAEKIVLGFPLYLAEWKTVDDSLRSDKIPDTGSGITVEPDCGISGTTCTRLAHRYAATYGKKYDNRDKSAYYSFYVCTGTKKGWRQVYFDDEQAFTEKFGIINNKNLRGVGFWAQNYDKGYLDTWNAIYNAFADKTLTSSPAKKSGFVTPPSIAKNDCSPTSPTPSPSPMLQKSIFRFSQVYLHGIGKGGDNQNPNTQGNLNPLTKTKNLKVEIYDKNNKLVAQTQGDLKYNSTLGHYSGDIEFNSGLPNNDYILKIKTDKFLRKQLPIIINFTNGSTFQIPTISLVNGNSNNDNALTILDYSLILDCYSDLLAPKNCSDSLKKSKADISDDGKVNQDDYNLFLRELSIVSGD